MSQYAYDPYLPARETNGLGVAGFVISLIGLVLTGGVLCPIGLVISLVALGRRPRGFAIAGTVLGFLGTCGGLLVLLLAGGTILAALGMVAIAIAMSEPERVELTTDMANIAVQVEQYREENHYVPASLTLLHIKDTVTTDPWGTPYKYLVLDDGKSFDVVSAGKDKTFDTSDDQSLTRLDKVWQGLDNIHIGRDQHGKQGAVEISFGDNKLNVTGSEVGGSVTIESGGKSIQIDGDEDGGSVNAGTSQPASQPGN
jgi:hypothetical protein